MRLVFIDMHCINFLTNVYSQIKSGMKIKTYKHKFIVEYALKNKIEILNYVSGLDTTNPWVRRMKKFSDSIKLSVKESEFVITHNYGNNVGIHVITDPSIIRKDDIVIGYFYKKLQREIISGLNGYRVMMGNHFVSINSPSNLKKEGIDAFVNEIDLSDNHFVNKYLNTQDVKLITCPYIYADRFKNLHKKRKNKMVAVGTLSTIYGQRDYSLYRKEFQTDWIQPMRKEIMDKSEVHPEEIDSYVSYINEDHKEIKDDDSEIVRMYKKVHNRFQPWTQSKYTSFDMVEKFNEYTMFICPEELVGMPGIGFVEGMACGTAYIGLDTPYYRKLGLLPGENYITYDGTYDDLIHTIRYYQGHVNETKKIAAAGEKLVRENFNADIVAKNFFRDLSDLSS